MTTSATKSEGLNQKNSNSNSNNNKKKRFHEHFDEHARATPSAIAVVSKHIQCTYAHLYRVSSYFASELQKKNVGPGVLVGICLPNSEGMIISTLAIMKAGGAFLPINHKFPRARMEHIVTDSKIDLVVTNKQYANSFTHIRTVLIEDFDNPSSAEVHPHDLSAKGTTAEEELAYCIYTSGSSGAPKGVLIGHESLSDFVQTMRDTYHPTPSWRVLQYSAITFDAYIWEIVAALAFGGCLVIVDDDSRIGQDLANVIASNKVTACLIPPTVWQTVPVCPLPSLTTLLLAGEVAAPSLATQWCEGRQLFNVYGPTETTVICTSFQYTSACSLDKIPIGYPIGEVRIYILDDDLSPVSPGATGEICIAGENVGKGYLFRPELTAAKFINNPFEGGKFARMYRTGDIGRMHPDGAIDFCGRRDFQVKINGVRIELEEIEAPLRSHPQISSVVVITKDHPTGKKLVAYYTLREVETQPLPSVELLEFSQKFIPVFMVPSLYICLPSLPMTTSGKVDRQYLAELPVSIGHHTSPASSTAAVLPTTPSQALLRTVWSTVLHLMPDQVRMDDNFFQLGGGSLSTFQVSSILHRKGVRGVEAYDVYRYPTIRSLADFIEKQNIQTGDGVTGDASGSGDGAALTSPAHWPRPRHARQYLLSIAISEVLARFFLFAEAVPLDADCIELLSNMFHPLSQLGFLDRLVQETAKRPGTVGLNLSRRQFYTHRSPQAIAATVAASIHAPSPTLSATDLSDSIPVGELEGEVLAVVQKVLGDSELHHHSDIYEALQEKAPMLREALRASLHAFPHPIPPLSFATTPYQVALALHAAASARILAHPPSAFVIPLCVPAQVTDKTPAIIFAHPALRTSLSYKVMSFMLGDEYAVYGLEESGEFQLYDNIQQMAERYCASCTSLFTNPARPLIVAGWSFGAALATELAVHLVRAGRSVQTVCVLDAEFPKIKTRNPVMDSVTSIMLVSLYLDKMLGSAGNSGGETSKITPATLVPLVTKSVMAGEQEISGEILDLFMEPYSALMPGAELRGYVARFYLDLIHSFRLLNYDPSPTFSPGTSNDAAIPSSPWYPWKTVVFRVAQQSESDDGWTKLGNVSFVDVPGNHHNMIFPPHASVLAQSMLKHF